MFSCVLRPAVQARAREAAGPFSISGSSRNQRRQLSTESTSKGTKPLSTRHACVVGGFPKAKKSLDSTDWCCSFLVWSPLHLHCALIVTSSKGPYWICESGPYSKARFGQSPLDFRRSVPWQVAELATLLLSAGVIGNCYGGLWKQHFPQFACLVSTDHRSLDHLAASLQVECIVLA